MSAYPTLVLLHGALQTGASLAPLAAALAPSAQLVSLNLPGHGGSPVPDLLRLQDMVDAVIGDLDRQGIEQAQIFGYSLGGYVGLLLAQQHPSRVKGVYAHATKLAWTPEAAAREVRGLDPDRLLEKAPAVAASLEQLHSPQHWRLLTQRVADLLIVLGDRPAIDATVLSNLQMPVQLSVGDHDRMVSLEETVAAYRVLPQGQLLVIPGSAHPLEPSVQRRLAPELLRFLEWTGAAG
ncbi:alpha/beta fold hydrolase [Deinococcus sp. QL22]|uniref:alpha/beta fold hydrolase n=1 Tax=Deinococcus sp. QL22 TaxID=2939437 RepID=UPI0020175546|nr:alpha/beta fold hydrolase [Deinococcus sp. QL22]UQN08863.1 alpha/beta fold hydrolase [Deinococcus sp. QL22]